MADNKNSFVLYTDLIHTVDKLPDEVAGKLFKHILAYVNDENPETEDLLLQVLFEPIKQQLKRDLKKWEGKTSQRSDAGATSAFNKMKPKFDLVEKDELPALLQKYELQVEQNPNKKYLIMCRDYILFLYKNQRPLDSVQHPSTNSTVSVSDSVTVSDNDIVNDINNKLMSEIKISDVPEKLKKYFEISEKFRLLFIKNLEEKNSPTKNQKNAKFKNYVSPIRLMMERDEVTREQLLTVYAFLDSKNCENEKFSWKSNILSTSKLREKFETLCSQANKNNNGNSEGFTSIER